MTEQDQTAKSGNIFLTLYKGIPKPIVYTLIAAMIIGAVSFSYDFAKQTASTIHILLATFRGQYLSMMLTVIKFGQNKS